MTAISADASSAAFRGQATATAYDALADAYDVLTASYCHDVWLGEIERLGVRHGLRGRRLLDLGCGTGKSFLPLLAHGYQVTGVDVSARMIDVAREKAPDVTLLVADMCDLERVGEFDLITCLDDAVNHLLCADQVEGFFASIARNLADGGLAVFDVNSLCLYEHSFRTHWLVDSPDVFIAWNGQSRPEVAAGDQLEATIDVFTASGSLWQRTQSRHLQRHWPRGELHRAAARSGLRIVASYGQQRGAVLEDRFDELEHHKALYFVVRESRG